MSWLLSRPAPRSDHLSARTAGTKFAAFERARAGLDTGYAGDRRVATPRFIACASLVLCLMASPGLPPASTFRGLPCTCQALAPLISVSFHAAAPCQQAKEESHCGRYIRHSPPAGSNAAIFNWQRSLKLLLACLAPSVSWSFPLHRGLHRASALWPRPLAALFLVSRSS